MSLVNAERRRLFKRRFTRYMLAFGILVLAAVVLGTWFSNQKVGPAQRAAAQQAADANYAEITEQIRRDCESNRINDEQFKRMCESGEVGPDKEYFTAENYLPPTFNFKTEFEQTIIVFAGVLALVGFVIGASYVGAEWNSGGMMNLLLWRPRRLQVLLTKLGTLLAGMIGIALLLGALWTAAFWLTGKFRGTTAGMTPGTWRSLELIGVRALALVLAAATVGFAIASLGRHTAMALGVAVGFGVVGQIAVGIVVGLAQIQFFERFLWPTYLAAWMDKSVKLEDFRSCELVQGNCVPKTMVITWHHSGYIFAVITAAVLVAAFWSMRRRDVT